MTASTSAITSQMEPDIAQAQQRHRAALYVILLLTQLSVALVNAWSDTVWRSMAFAAASLLTFAAILLNRHLDTQRYGAALSLVSLFLCLVISTMSDSPLQDPRPAMALTVEFVFVHSMQLPGPMTAYGTLLMVPLVAVCLELAGSTMLMTDNLANTSQANTSAVNGAVICPAFLAAILSISRSFDIAKNRALVYATREASDTATTLKKYLTRLDLATSHGGVGLFITDAAQHELDVNGVARELFDLPEPDCPTVTLRDAANRVHPEDRSLVLGGHSKLIETGIDVTTRYRVVHRNGEVRHVRGQGAVIPIEGGGYALAGSAIDETELVLAKTHLIRKEEQQRRMFGVIAHELRTPAAAIDMMLSNTDETCEQVVFERSDLEQLRSTSKHLLSVIDDLLGVEESACGGS